MPEKTLLALADHGEVGALLPPDGGDAEALLARFTRSGIDLGALAEKLQRDGAQAFVTSWDGLLAQIAAKSATLKRAG
jgi:transaldolase